MSSELLLRVVALSLIGVSASCHAPKPAPSVSTPKPPPPIVEGEPARSKLLAEHELIKARVKRISDELAALKRDELRDSDWAKEWAGTYYEGDGLGTNVTIYLAPKSGIGFLNYGCLGLYGGDHGEITEVLSDGLRLKLALGTKGGGFLSERMYFVRWGNRRYLVPDWAMMKVVNNYNEGGYARESMYGAPRLHTDGIIRSRFGEAVPDGKPELPPEFAKLLLPGPLTLKLEKAVDLDQGKVTTGVGRRSWKLTFSVGSDSGVYPGMTFRMPSDFSRSSGTVTVTSVEAKSCSGELIVYAGENEVIAPPVVGEEVVIGQPAPKVPALEQIEPDSSPESE